MSDKGTRVLWSISLEGLSAKDLDVWRLGCFVLLTAVAVMHGLGRDQQCLRDCEIVA